MSGVRDSGPTSFCPRCGRIFEERVNTYVECNHGQNLGADRVKTVKVHPGQQALDVGKTRTHTRDDF